MKRKTQKHRHVDEGAQAVVQEQTENTENTEEQDVWLEELRGALSPHWSSRLEYQTHKRKGSDQ